MAEPEIPTRVTTVARTTTRLAGAVRRSTSRREAPTLIGRKFIGRSPSVDLMATDRLTWAVPSADGAAC